VIKDQVTGSESHSPGRSKQ